MFIIVQVINDTAHHKYYYWPLYYATHIKNTIFFTFPFNFFFSLSVQFSVQLHPQHWHSKWNKALRVFLLFFFFLISVWCGMKARFNKLFSNIINVLQIYTRTIHAMSVLLFFLALFIFLIDFRIMFGTRSYTLF